MAFGGESLKAKWPGAAQPTPALLPPLKPILKLGPARRNPLEDPARWIMPRPTHECCDGRGRLAALRRGSTVALMPSRTVARRGMLDVYSSWTSDRRDGAGKPIQGEQPTRGATTCVAELST